MTIKRLDKTTLKGGKRFVDGFEFEKLSKFLRIKEN